MWYVHIDFYHLWKRAVLEIQSPGAVYIPHILLWNAVTGHHQGFSSWWLLYLRHSHVVDVITALNARVWLYSIYHCSVLERQQAEARQRVFVKLKSTHAKMLHEQDWGIEGHLHATKHQHCQSETEEKFLREGDGVMEWIEYTYTPQADQSYLRRECRAGNV